jgi:GAF domain-containing protein
MTEGPTPAQQTPPSNAVLAVSHIPFVPTVLKLVCEATGLRWSAVAHVTEDSWTACAVHDGLGFGIQPGGQLDVEETFCIDVKRHGKPIAMNHASCDLVYADHRLPAQYGFESYLSMPIMLSDGSFFGTLCALDPEPRTVADVRTSGMFEGFAALIGSYLDVEAQRDNAQAALLARMREHGKNGK